ncbi:MAG: hypothetical protein JSS10_08010 [Verrucomicrobia bacterium]|nr:hypothetical protein [Verrucomicrobiota bacterium]
MTKKIDASISFSKSYPEAPAPSMNAAVEKVAKPLLRKVSSSPLYLSGSQNARAAVVYCKIPLYDKGYSPPRVAYKKETRPIHTLERYST